MERKSLVLILILILAIGLIGCGSSSGTVSSNNEKTSTGTTSKPKSETQDEINQQIKKEATQADFVKLNGHEDEYTGKPFFIEGEITNIDNTDSVLPVFTVTTKENNGSGMYDVLNFSKVDINKGDKVKVYGKLSGKSKINLPEISGNVIDKE